MMGPGGIWIFLIKFIFSGMSEAISAKLNKYYAFNWALNEFRFDSGENASWLTGGFYFSSFSDFYDGIAVNL